MRETILERFTNFAAKRSLFVVGLSVLAGISLARIALWWAHQA